MALIGLKKGAVDPVAGHGGGGDVQFPAPLRVPQPLSRQLYVGGRHLIQLVEDQEVTGDRLHAHATVGAPEVDGAQTDLLEPGGVGVADQTGQVVRLSDCRREAVAAELTHVVIGGEEVDDPAAVGDGKVKGPADGVLARSHLGGFAHHHQSRLLPVDTAQVVVPLEGEGVAVDQATSKGPVKQASRSLAVGGQRA